MPYNIQGKTVIFLGSSVTFGSASNGISFADYLGERNNCNIIKEAVSGTTLTDDSCDSYIRRMEAIQYDNADIFVCQLSTNDATKNKPLGSVEKSDNKDGYDTKTVAGAIEYIITYAKKRWNCPVVFYTNPRYESVIYEEMADLLNVIAEKHGISVIDTWNDAEFNTELDIHRKEYMADRIHPTAEGYLHQWTPYFEKALSSLCL